MTIIKRILQILLGLIIVVAAIYFFGPKPIYSTLDNTPIQNRFEISEIDAYLNSEESKIENLKPDNEARVVWYDSIPSKTEYSIVYIHGFSASQGEGYPIHLNLAKRFKSNLFLARLEDHGLSSKEAFREIDPSEWVKDAAEAVAIGKSIGDKVILMSCSTGGTISIFLAANDPDIHALVLLSPNIDIYNPSADMVTGPWGRQLAYRIMGEYRDLSRQDSSKYYWSGIYHTDGVVALQALIDQAMKPSIFEKINIPVYCGYYYKNEKEQDFVVSVDAMLDFKTQISSTPDQVEFEPFPNAGNHVIGSRYRTDNYLDVQNEIVDFLEKKVGM